MNRSYSDPKRINKSTIQLDVTEKVDGKKVNGYPLQVEKDDSEYQLKTLYKQAEAGEFGELAGVSGADLELLKTNAVQQLTILAAKHQRGLMGTDDPDRQLRFATNLIAAKALLSSNANTAQQEMLEIQLLANQQSGHEKTSAMTVRQFAEWITSYDDIMTRAAGMLEALFITYRSQISNVADEAQMEALVEQFDQQAADQIQELLQ